MINLSRTSTMHLQNLLWGLLPSDATRLLFTSSIAWNPNAFTAGLDLTCVSSGNPTTGNVDGYNVTAISPNFVVQCQHAATGGPNSPVRFVDPRDGTQIVRNVNTGRQVPMTDIQINRLDSSLPPSIRPARLMTSKRALQLENTTLCLSMDGDKRVGISIWDSITPGFMGFASFMGTYRGAYHPVDPWATVATDGSSGAPIFMLDENGQPVLVSHWTTQATGPCYADNIEGINDAIAALGGGMEDFV